MSFFLELNNNNSHKSHKIGFLIILCQTSLYSVIKILLKEVLIAGLPATTTIFYKKILLVIVVIYAVHLLYRWNTTTLLFAAAGEREDKNKVPPLMRPITRCLQGPSHIN